jgi:hypothetical protein
MKRKLMKLSAAVGLAIVSTAAFAAANGGCGMECCLKMLECCC